MSEEAVPLHIERYITWGAIIIIIVLTEFILDLITPIREKVNLVCCNTRFNPTSLPNIFRKMSTENLKKEYEANIAFEERVRLNIEELERSQLNKTV